MNSVLLHGIRRPNAVVLSSTSFYARAVRLQSSEPEQVGEEELHTIAGGHPGAFSSDDVPPPQPSQRNSDASAYRANGNATPRLPWENVASKLPPKANGNHGNLEALSRSRAAGGSLGTAASAQFPWDTVGSTQRTPVSKLNGNSSAPRVLAREGEIAAVYSRDLPRQGSQKPPVSQGLSLHSQRQNNNNSQNNSQAEARLPWERMLDVLPPKSQAGANGLAQSKANTERIQPSKLEGLANGFGRPVPKAERSLNGSTLSVNGSRLQPQVGCARSAGFWVDDFALFLAILQEIGHALRSTPRGDSALLNCFADCLYALFLQIMSTGALVHLLALVYTKQPRTVSMYCKYVPGMYSYGYYVAINT